MTPAAPPVWCLACRDNLIVAACADGRVEVRQTAGRARVRNLETDVVVLSRDERKSRTHVCSQGREVTKTARVICS